MSGQEFDDATYSSNTEIPIATPGVVVAQTYENIPEADIVGLQFGLVTAEDADNWGFRELDEVSTKRNAPGYGTVNCTSLGTTQNGILCIACGGNIDACTGHCGKLTLFQPVCNVNYFHILPKILSCFCIHCGRLLLPKDHPRNAKGRRNSSGPVMYKRAVKELASLTSRYKTCWFPSVGDAGYEELPHYLSKEEARVRGYCGARQPDMWIRDEGVLIRPVYFISEESHFEDLPKITPQQLARMLFFVPDEEVRMFGFDPVMSPLHAMMVPILLVPPGLIRPMRSAHGNEDDLTKTLRTIQLYNRDARRNIVPNLTLGLLRTDENAHLTLTAAKKKMKRVQGEMTTTLMRNKQPIVAACLEDYFLLQRATACLWDSKYDKKLDAEFPTSGRETFSLKKRFAPGKRTKGRMRQDMLGKPGESTIRTTATCNSDMEIDEIGIPISAMMHCTYPVVVNDINYKECLRMVLNGKQTCTASNFRQLFHRLMNEQHQFAGCAFVERNGELYLPDANFGGLQKGDIVHRQMRKGDPIIGNRQPSLHRFAIMGYRVVPSEGEVIQASLAVTYLLGLDFDGDELNGYMPQSVHDQAETKYLLNVTQNLIKDGQLVIGFVQHAVLGAYMLTNQRYGSIILSRKEVQRYLHIGKNEKCIQVFNEAWEAYNRCQKLTGREFMSLLLPTYNPHIDVEPMTKSSLNNYMGLTIESYRDMEFAALRIGFLTRLLEAFCTDAGVTLHIDDCRIPTVPTKVRNQAETIFNDAVKFAGQKKSMQQVTRRNEYQHAEMSSSAQEFLESLYNRSKVSIDEVDSLERKSEIKLENTENYDQDDDLAEVENAICDLTDLYRDVYGKQVISVFESSRNPRGMLSIVKSRTKGTEANIAQNVAVVGQQRNDESERYDTTTSHYYRNELAKYGFITSSFMDGPTPTELFYHLRAARTGLIATACGTSLIGYMYRKLFKSVEDVRAMFDNTVRNAVGDIILTHFGFDTTFLTSVSLKIVTLSIRETIQLFATSIAEEAGVFESSCEYLQNPDPSFQETIATIVDTSYCGVQEVERLLILRERAIEKDPRLIVLVPVRFDKKFTCHQQSKCHGQIVSLNAARNQVVQMWLRLVLRNYMSNSPSMEALFFEQLSSRYLINRKLLNCVHIFRDYMQYIEETFAQNLNLAGDPCGMKASQECMQPVTQTNLKRTQITGEKTKIVTGMTRVKELLNMQKKIQQPLMHVLILPEFESTFDPMTLIELRLSDVVTSYTDQPHPNTLRQQREQITLLDDFQDDIFLTLYLNKNAMHRREISPRALTEYIRKSKALVTLNDGDVCFEYAPLDNSEWWIMMTFKRQTIGPIAISLSKKWDTLPNPMLSLLLQHALFHTKQPFAGIEGIRDFALSKKQLLISDDADDGKLVQISRPCYILMGSNVQAVCSLPEVDVEYTMSNDIHQIYAEFGIDAAQTALEHNLMEAIESSNTSVAIQHVKLIAATMCFCGYPAALTFSGMTSRDTASWLKRATFERSLDSFIGAGIAAHKDTLRGISEAIVVGTKISVGTGGDFTVLPNPTVKRQVESSLEISQPHGVKRARFHYMVPDIKQFLTQPLENDEFVKLDFNKKVKVAQHDGSSRKTCLGESGHSGRRSKGAQVTQTEELEVFFARQEHGNVLIPSSPTSSRVSDDTAILGSYDPSNILHPSSPTLSGCTHDLFCQFGTSGLLVPTSPKQRKKTVKRKGRPQRSAPPMDEFLLPHQQSIGHSSITLREENILIPTSP